jgi:hypothetical protein
MEDGESRIIKRNMSEKTSWQKKDERETAM